MKKIVGTTRAGKPIVDALTAFAQTLPDGYCISIRDGGTQKSAIAILCFNNSPVKWTIEALEKMPENLRFSECVFYLVERPKK